MTIAQRGGLLASAVLALIGIAALMGGVGYGVTVDGGEIGPGFLPAFAGGLVAVFAVLDVISRLRRRNDLPTQAELILDTVEPVRSDTDPDGDLDIFGRTQKQRNRILALVLGLVIAALLAVQLVGFLVSFVLLIFAIAVAVEKRKILPAAVVSLAAGAATYAIFVVLLRVPLPQGLLEIV